MRLLLLILSLLFSAVNAYAVPINILSSSFQVSGKVEGELYIGQDSNGNPMWEHLYDKYSLAGSRPQSGFLNIERIGGEAYPVSLNANSTADYFSLDSYTEAYDHAISGFGESFSHSNIFFSPTNDFSGLSVDYINDLWGYVETKIYDVTLGTVLLDSKYCGGGLGMGYTVATGQFSESVADLFFADHTYQLTLTAYKNSNEDSTLNSSISVNGLEMFIVPEPSTLFLLVPILLVLLIGNMKNYRSRFIQGN
jgi:hypothetical protein